LTLALKKLLKVFFSMPRYLTPIQTARAKLEENWSLAAVAKDSFLLKIIY
jgi:hypothetical protein